MPAWVAEVTVETLTDEWRAAVGGQLSTIATNAFWKHVRRRGRSQFDCAVLADIADALESAKSWAHDAMGVLARGVWQRLRRPEPERALAETLAKRIPLPGDEEIDEVVRCLRIVGVYVCLNGGSDVLACPCFHALAKEKTKDELRSVLEEKLDAAFPGSPSTCPSTGV